MISMNPLLTSLVGFSGNLWLAVRGSCMHDEHIFVEQPLNETESFPLDVSEERKSIEKVRPSIL